MLKNLSHSAELTLLQAIDLRVIIDKHPELINLKKLALGQKMSLLTEDNQTLTKLILSSTILTAKEKLYIVCEFSKKFCKDNNIFLTKSDIDLLGDSDYGRLLDKDFGNYFIPEKWKKMSAFRKGDIFIKNAEYFFKNKIDYPGLTKFQLSRLCPSLIDQYFTEEQIKKVKPNSTFWIRMIRYDPIKYEPMFIRCLKIMPTSTDIREVFYSYRKLIKVLKITDIENTKLSLKQWVLLFKNIVSSETKETRRTPRGKKSCDSIFNNWQFDSKFVEEMELGLTLEMLDGKSKASKQFQNAMTFLKTLNPDIEEENETENFQ